MIAWQWLLTSTVLAIHDRQLAGHGGLAGVRDMTLLESALARPQNLEAYGSPDAAELAAAYAFGIARNHPFVDGNKRTAFVAAVTFLIDNAILPQFKEVDVVLTIMKLAAGEMTEAELASWFRGGIRPGLHDDATPYTTQRKSKAVRKKPGKKTAPKKKAKKKL
jgi:death on curing protein